MTLEGSQDVLVSVPALRPWGVLLRQLYTYGNVVDTYETAVLRYQLAPACTYGII